MIKIQIKNWTVYSLEFHKGVSGVSGWKKFKDQNKDEDAENQDNNGEVTLEDGPRLFMAAFTIEDEQPYDTYLSLNSKWTKGVAFCNGFNLGRYWNIGPQKTLYIPGPLLFKGFNHIQLFELFTYGRDIDLIDEPIIDIFSKSDDGTK